MLTITDTASTVVKEIVDAEYVWFPGEVKLTVWAAFATVTP